MSNIIGSEMQIQTKICIFTTTGMAIYKRLTTTNVGNNMEQRNCHS